MYNYNHLYYFYMTVKSEGVTSAANHLFISQPSLSGQLKVLEDYLQLKLFTKVGRKNQLTPEGALVYDYCRQMFELSEQMHDSLNDRATSDSRKVYIGVSAEIANSFVVEVVSHFLNKYSDEHRPKVVMVSGQDEDLLEQLRFKELDVVVSTLPKNHSDLENLHRIEIPVNLMCTYRQGMSIEESGGEISTLLPRLSERGGIDWVMPHLGTKLRSEINHYFERSPFRGRIVFESDVVESLTRSVVDNVGVAFLPVYYVPKELESKSLYSLGPREGYWKYNVWLTTHVNNCDDELIQSLSESFESAGGSSLSHEIKGGERQ